MNCFSETDFQIYVDGEATKEEAKRLEYHTARCMECQNNLERQKQRAAKMKMVLHELLDTVPPAPALHEFAKPERPTISLKRKLAYGMAAACVLFVLVLVNSKQPELSVNTNDTMLFYSVDFEIDANKPIVEQELIIYRVDGNSNIANDENMQY